MTGLCPYCGVELSDSGDCLNLCLMPNGSAQRFQAGLLETISRHRSNETVAEKLAGCDCPPAALSGYQTRRDPGLHSPGCPLRA